MDENEIKTYCTTGSGVCVYRKRVKKAQFVVQSIYILRDSPKKYRAHVEFDAMTMVDQGDGIRWISEAVELSKMVTALEKFLGLNLNHWSNFTGSDIVPNYVLEMAAEKHHANSWTVLEQKYDNGRLLLPGGLFFRLASKIHS